jgi:hypothetical protein
MLTHRVGFSVPRRRHVLQAGRAPMGNADPRAVPRGVGGGIGPGVLPDGYAGVSGPPGITDLSITDLTACAVRAVLSAVARPPSGRADASILRPWRACCSAPPCAENGSALRSTDRSPLGGGIPPTARGSVSPDSMHPAWSTSSAEHLNEERPMGQHQGSAAGRAHAGIRLFQLGLRNEMDLA